MSKLLPQITAKKDLKAVRTKMRFKKADVRQCRLCLRLLPRDDVLLTAEYDGYDIRGKISDAVAVKIVDSDKVTGVCKSCLLLIEIVNHFRETCRKADIIQRNRLLVMHPGNWTSPENKQTFTDCHNLMKRHRSEMDALFKCFERKEEEEKEKKKKKEVQYDAEFLDEVTPDYDKDTLNPSWDPLTQDEHLMDTGIEINDTNPSPPIQMIDQLSNTTPTQVRNHAVQENNKKTAPRLPVSETYDSPFAAYGRKMVMCDMCGKFTEMTNIASHRNKHLGLRPFVCNYDGCDKRFFGKKNLLNHTYKHLAEQSLVQCQICKRTVKGSSQLKKHMLVHSEENGRKAPCTICGKKFYKCYLKDHMAVHTGCMAYPCGFCDRQFAAMSNRFTHWKKVHPNENPSKKPRDAVE